jgi:hypothetical protein
MNRDNGRLKELGMKRLRWLAACCVALLGASILSAQGDKVPSVHDIMEKAHKVKSGLRDKIATEAKAASPKWDDAKKMSKEFVDLANALEKNKPPKGPEDSWKKLSKSYAAEVKALDEAVGKKDKMAVDKANKVLGANCKGCHDAHQE